MSDETKPRPTIAELEAILNDTCPHRKVEIQPNGEVRTVDLYERLVERNAALESEHINRASNCHGPIDRLRDEHARVMASLVRAMKAAQNWHDVLAVADLMVEVEVCRFGPMLNEAIREGSDMPRTSASAGAEGSSSNREGKEP